MSLGTVPRSYDTPVLGISGVGLTIAAPVISEDRDVAAVFDFPVGESAKGILSVGEGTATIRQGKEMEMDHRFQKITPFLWFDHQAEEAARFYVSVFDNSRITKTVKYSDEGAEASGRPKGTAMTVMFQLEGQNFVALNGGPYFKFNEAVSFVVNCATQEEVDRFWEKLSEGGDPQAQQCGWLKDRYGLSWQVVPTILAELLGDSDTEKARRVMKALLQMKKIDVDDLLTAAGGQ